MTLYDYLVSLRQRGTTTRQWCEKHRLPYVNTIQVARGTRRPGPVLARDLHEATGRKVALKTLRQDIWG